MAGRSAGLRWRRLGALALVAASASLTASAAALTATSAPSAATASGTPIGNLDIVSSPANGKVHLEGWAFDPSNPAAHVTIFVYIGGPPGSGAPGANIGPTTTKRTDVQAAFKARYPTLSATVGFSYTLSGVSTGVQKIYAYAINIGPGNSAVIGSKSANIGGGTWSIATSANPDAQDSLTDIACPSPSNCMAVGDATPASNITAPLAEHWNGTTWVGVATQNVAGARAAYFNGVACATSTDCFAVGDYDVTLVSGDDDLRTLIERWNGATWSIVASPEHAGANIGVLTAIACPSPTSCFASGDWGSHPLELGPFDGKPLVEHWDGAHWSVMSTPTPSGSTSELYGIACPGPTSCFAVGAHDNVGTLTERWNGTSWSIAASPAPAGATFVQLTGVSCPGATTCWAVGEDDAKTLTERWNGNAWAIVASPNPGGSSQRNLAAVSCVAPAQCFAVGFSDAHTLVEQWNGVAWTIVASPTPIGATSAQLDAVSCPSAPTCVSAGTRNPAGGHQTTLVERRG